MIPYGRQLIDQADIDTVCRALRGDLLTTGPEIKAFENELAEFCGAKYAVACANGTAALHLAGLAAGIGPGDLVITSPITFLASANFARFCGADVAFADIEGESANMDPAKLAEKMEPRVKAVVPVHFGGSPANMEAIARIADQHGAIVIDDASHALGATYLTGGGERVKVGSGRHSRMTTFSFHPVKHLTTGEGGAITTNDPGLYEKLLKLRSHGMVSQPEKWENLELGFDADGSPNPWYYEMPEIGFNYRITDIQCALGRSQMKKLPGFLERRRFLAETYRREMAGLPHVKALGVASGNDSAYHLFVVLIDFAALGMSRGRMMKELRARGIGSQVHYIPVNRQPYYRRLGISPDTPRADRYYEQCLSLPLFPAMSDQDVQSVMSALRGVLGI